MIRAIHFERRIFQEIQSIQFFFSLIKILATPYIIYITNLYNYRMLIHVSAKIPIYLFFFFSNFEIIRRVRKTIRSNKLKEKGGGKRFVICAATNRRFNRGTRCFCRVIGRKPPTFIWPNFNSTPMEVIFRGTLIFRRSTTRPIKLL